MPRRSRISWCLMFTADDYRAMADWISTRPTPLPNCYAERIEQMLRESAQRLDDVSEAIRDIEGREGTEDV